MDFPLLTDVSELIRRRKGGFIDVVQESSPVGKDRERGENRRKMAVKTTYGHILGH